ncbi:MAG: hypothetical protein AABZ12_09970 [Planctomycetota bacterium]
MGSARYRVRIGKVPGGLSGKARQNSSLSRASRIHAQQLIEEYLDATDEDDAMPQRSIRFGHRAEFIPTATETLESADPTESVPDEQLQLSWERSTPDFADAAAVASDSTDERLDAQLTLRSAPTVDRRILVGQAAVATRRPDQDAKANRLDVDTTPFRPARFVYGCLLGSAAAAAILLIVQLALL